MNTNHLFIVLLVVVTGCNTAKKQEVTDDYNQMHRPQIHFSPKKNWMNDPNGMVYFNGVYHLFFQYYPDSTVWGPMHWGHATSKDLVHWEQQPIKLYPDSLGYIFSGSVVADVTNTSGFGTNGKIPLVAVFTHHNPVGEKAGSNDYQVQSIAYSIDEGKTWVKYANNPVLNNPGIKDFRDPKVMWYEEDKKWVMTLATKDRITFYSSPDLKNWTRESEFGSTVGAHGGVWECPDLFPLEYQGREVWILLVSINPGGLHGGSATQYFTGEFDGKTFISDQTDTRWIDYGPDNYAGVTWSNTGKRKIFLGWMSNWQYATVVPTDTWRSAMTLPRDLTLEKQREKYLLVSRPVPELDNLAEQPVVIDNITGGTYDLTAKTGKLTRPVRLSITLEKIETFSFTLSNSSGEQVIIGYDKGTNHYFIDRSKSGKVSFEKSFAGRHTGPRLSTKENIELTLITDNASVELFADNGQTVMTEIFFPSAPFTDITLQSPGGSTIKSVQYKKLRSILK